MNILILCGGRSAERDVSCVSAAAILRNLSKRWHPILVHIDVQGKWHYQRNHKAFARHPKPFSFPFNRIPATLELGSSPALKSGSRRLPVGVVFPALHGPMGEDGTLQGMLELAGVPYVGCGVLGSALAMDKEFTKRLAIEAGLPVLPYVTLETPQDIKPARRLKFPVFVKPARLGSSVGVYRVSRPSQLAESVRRAFRFDSKVLVEQGVPAREIECAVLGGDEHIAASIPGEIRPNAEFYSYEAKYLDPNGAKLLIPAGISERQARQVRKMSILAFKALDLYGLARVDFLLDRSTGKIWFNEANTLPGFTSISMYPKLWAASGLAFPRLLDRLITLALSRHRRRAHLSVTRD